MKESGSSRVAHTPASGNQRRRPNIIKVLKETPRKYHGSNVPLNLEEQKNNFLRYGIPPTFVLRKSQVKSQSQGQGQAAAGQTHDNKKPVAQISTTLLPDAVRILEAARARFPSSDEYIDRTYGHRITYKQGSALLSEYLHDNKLNGQIGIVWAGDLDCSGRMMWHGPNTRLNRPEARKHTLLIKNSPENVFQRRQGIICLANHEIGTHYLRNVNDGLQPWYSDRLKFGLRSASCYESTVTEEGLATLHTLLQAKSKYLYHAALLYYTASMAEEMTFQELFDHLEKYVQSPEQRWKHVMRVKRVLVDPNGLGGYGKDQCYFEGAVSILQNIDTIDFPLLYSGRVCLDELDRVKRLARLNCIRLPHFMEDYPRYRRLLRHIGIVNGIIKARVRTSAQRLKAKAQPSPAVFPPLYTPPPPNNAQKRKEARKKLMKSRNSTVATALIWQGDDDEDINEYARTLSQDPGATSVAIVEPLDTRVGSDILVTVPFANVKFYDRALSPLGGLPAVFFSQVSISASQHSPSVAATHSSSATTTSTTTAASGDRKFNLGTVFKKLSSNEKALIYTVATTRKPDQSPALEECNSLRGAFDNGLGKPLTEGDNSEEEEEDIEVAFHKPSTSVDEIKSHLERLARRERLSPKRLTSYT